MGFPREEYQRGLPFPPPGDLPDPGTKPTSPALVGGFLTAASGEASYTLDPGGTMVKNLPAKLETQV